MFNLGMGEITVILLLALIVLGPSKLPDLAAGLGKLIRDIRKATSDVKNEIIMDDSFRKPFEELRDAVTLPPEELKRRDQIRKNMEEARKRAEEEEAARAAAAALMTPAEGEGAAALPETPADATLATTASGPEVAVPPVAAPAGTVARTRPAAAVVASEAPSAPHPVPAPPVTGGPRVVPPTSSLEGDRANVTQALSEADLLASAPQPPRRPTPPPLPGLSRPPAGKLAPPRPTPVAPIRTAGPNATQVLSENDLLPPGGTAAAGATPPPPAADPKKT
ncbi:MAG TPA: twin-arginine translocase TatA/TatE family subunit [Polyangia bacterium]|nr:twin-arginine translocase TatA/TatE family subunit [Polyangia bacterium]